MKNTGKFSTEKFRLITTIGILVVLVACLAGLPVFAWFYLHKSLAAYAPVSSPEALFIGAGHCESEKFEDIRYMYFDGISCNDEKRDYVFCVYGKAVSGYKLQLAYTTNNQFTYEIYEADEFLVTDPDDEEEIAAILAEHEDAVPHKTHETTPKLYYYATKTDVPIAGTFLNKKTVSGEDLGKTSDDATLLEPYIGTYDTGGGSVYEHVDKYAEPVYWQTSATIRGDDRQDFFHYYILRVKTEDKASNDRETDILCLAAKSFTYVAP